MIHKLFKVDALRSAIVGSEEKDVHCLKEQETCHAGLELLIQKIKLASEHEDNLFVFDNDEKADAAPHKMEVDEVRRVTAILTLTKVLFVY